MSAIPNENSALISQLPKPNELSEATKSILMENGKENALAALIKSENVFSSTINIPKPKSNRYISGKSLKRPNCGSSEKAKRKVKARLVHAINVIKKLERIPQLNLTDAQIKEFTWAKSIWLNSENVERVLDPTVKRKRSLEANIDEATALSASAVVKGHKVLSVGKNVKPNSNISISWKSSKLPNFGNSKKARRKARLRLAEAMVVVEKLEKIPHLNLTDVQIKNLTWAKSILPYTTSVKAIEESNIKRQRSPEANVDEPKQGKMYDDSALSGSAVDKGHKILAVVNKGNADGALTLEQWNETFAALLRTYMEILKNNPGPPPICREAGWYRSNVRLMSFADERSQFLFRIALENIGELWPGCNLQLVDIEDIEKRPEAITWIPEVVATLDISAIIKMSNPELPCENWKVLKVAEQPVNGRKWVLLLINNETLPVLEREHGAIGFGFSSLTLKVLEKGFDDNEMMDEFSAVYPEDKAALDNVKKELEERVESIESSYII